MKSGSMTVSVHALNQGRDKGKPMKFIIIDNVTGQIIDVTDDVIDTLELGQSPAWTDSLVTEGVDIAADIARTTFGHDDINAGTD